MGKTYDEMAMEILLSSRTPEQRQEALRKLSAKADRHVARKIHEAKYGTTRRGSR